MIHSRYEHYKTNRQKRKAFYLRLLGAVCLAGAFLVVMLLVAAGERSVYINVRKNLYFVCFQTVYREDVANSVSSVICSGGGAGYVLQRGKGYAVVYSLYLRERDALSVCENLKDGGQNAEVVALSVDKVYLPASAVSNAERIISFYNIFYDCISLLSKTAEELDAGRIDFNGARCALESGADVLSGLVKTLGEGNKSERKKCLFLKDGAENAEQLIRGYVEGIFSSSDIRSIYVNMGDFYIKSAQKLQK